MLGIYTTTLRIGYLLLIWLAKIATSKNEKKKKRKKEKKKKK